MLKNRSKKAKSVASTQSTAPFPTALLFLAVVTAVLLVAGCDRPKGETTASDATTPVSPGASDAQTLRSSSAIPTPQQTSAPTTVAPEAAADSQSAPATEEPSDTIDAPPPVRLEPAVLDFGILAPSVTREGVIKLVNTGTKELEILTVQPSCKCTTTEDMSGQKIPVGGSVDLKASMKAQSAPGRKGAEIKVLIDGYSQVLSIQLKQEVSLPVRLSPSYLNVVKGQPTKGRTVIESIDKQPFTICSIGGKKPNLVDFDPAKDAPRSQYLLDWDFERDFVPGEAKRYWIVETDRADCPLVDIFVRHETTIILPRGLVPNEYRHTFGRLDQGSNFDFVLEVTRLGSDDKIVAAASASSAARVELVGATTEGEVTKVALRVVPNPDTLGVTWIPFTVYSAGGKQVEQAIWGQYVPKGTVGCYGK